MKKIVGEILKKRNIDENLKAYYSEFMEINNKYAYVRLAMNYYTYYMMLSEDGVAADVENMEAVAKLNSVIEKLSENSDDLVKSDIEEVEALREGIIGKVQDLTCYVDRFNVYEHALNRVEYRFKEQEYPADYTDENFTRKLMQFILADEDNMTVNRKISQITGQLPLRFTKNKFYEMISDGLSIYKGGTKESFQDFIYMIRTSCMLEDTDTMAYNYPHLSEMFEKFGKVSFKDITQVQYEDMLRDISETSEYIEEVMNSHMMVQTIINDLLIVLYTMKYQKDDNVVKACMEIVKNTNLLFLGKFALKEAEAIEDMFVMLEGTQEDLYPKLTTYDITSQIAESYSENIENLGLTEVYQTVYKLPKLNSDSMFAEIDKIADESVADEVFIENEKAKLIEDFAKLFKENEKMINRAVMSAAIAELPVFFNNISELQDFIFNTLSICTDKAEKLACIEILNGVMEE